MPQTIRRARILILQQCEQVLAGMIDGLETLRQRVAVCSDCGANRYTGEPCANNSKVSTILNSFNEVTK